MAEFFLNEFIVNVDVAIYQFVDSIMNPVLDVIMTFITHLGDTPGIVWWVIAAILVIPRKTRKLGILLIGGLAVASLINNVALKNLIERPRPYNLDAEVWTNAGYEYIWPNLIKQSSSWSFPSGHTSTSIGAAFAMLLGCLKNKKFLAIGIPTLILSFLIGFSRIYVHVHYPTDVIAGAVVGIVGGLIAYLLFAKLLFPKVVPVIEKKLNKKIMD
ncbi:MAG: phosphatase PAP2 family protein [Clostridia bacterium]|nr:phosphatase PAP2 family protein [Clostridia bacterium]